MDLLVVGKEFACFFGSINAIFVIYHSQGFEIDQFWEKFLFQIQLIRNFNCFFMVVIALPEK